MKIGVKEGFRPKDFSELVSLAKAGGTRRVVLIDQKMRGIRAQTRI